MSTFSHDDPHALPPVPNLFARPTSDQVANAFDAAAPESSGWMAGPVIASPAEQLPPGIQFARPAAQPAQPFSYATSAAPAHVMSPAQSAPAPASAPIVIDIPTPVSPYEEAHQRSTLAVIITFSVVIVGLWAILGFVHSMAQVLSSVDASQKHIVVQLNGANEGLAQLKSKTGHIQGMAADAKVLHASLGGINENMGSMLTGVNAIGTQMQALGTSLDTLDTAVTTVGATNTSIASKLGTINTGLSSEATKVRTLKGDVVASAGSLAKVPSILTTTNSRLTFVNGVVCYMGTTGMQNPLAISIDFLGIPNGSATIHATIVPPGGWGCK